MNGSAIMHNAMARLGRLCQSDHSVVRDAAKEIGEKLEISGTAWEQLDPLLAALEVLAADQLETPSGPPPRRESGEDEFQVHAEPTSATASLTYHPEAEERREDRVAVHNIGLSRVTKLFVPRDEFMRVLRSMVSETLPFATPSKSEANTVLYLLMVLSGSGNSSPC